jgi:aminoglycoside 2''-phosphotransferase
VHEEVGKKHGNPWAISSFSSFLRGLFFLRSIDSGERFIWYPLVPGTLLEPEVLLSRTAACQTALARQMAEFVRRLHSFSVQTARTCGLREKNPIHFLRELQRRASSALAPQLDAAVWQYHQRLFEQYFATLALHAYTPALLHGDLSPGHWLGILNAAY